MANTNISKSGNVVSIAFGGDTNTQKTWNAGTPVTYNFFASGTFLKVKVYDDEYDIPFASLDVSGSHPSTVADAYTALTTVFS